MYSATLAEYEVYRIVYSAGIGIYTLYKNKILRFAMTILPRAYRLLSTQESQHIQYFRYSVVPKNVMENITVTEVC
jgi:hypothetical protein